MTDIGRLVPQKAVAQDLGCCVRTLVRRIAEDPEFPRPVVIGSRHYFSDVQINEYKMRLFRSPGVTPQKSGSNLPSNGTVK